MIILYAPPVNTLLSIALLGVAGASLRLCIRQFRAAAGPAKDYMNAACIVRAIRWLVIALTALAWSAGFFWSAGWLFIIGLVFIGQELYECAFLLAALRLEDGAVKGSEGDESSRDSSQNVL